MRSDPWRNYDAWKTTNPEEEAAYDRQSQREKLAEFRRCSVDDIDDDELDEWLADDADAKLAAEEDEADRKREERMWRDNH